MPAGGSVQQRQGRSDFARPGQSAVVLPHGAREGAPPPPGEDRVNSRDITLPTKVHLVKAVVFPVVMYGCESWIIKKSEQIGRAHV